MNSKTLIVTLCFLVIISCGEKKQDGDIQNQTQNVDDTLITKQLNVNILLDLSDRLIQDVIPTTKERDIEIIRAIVSIFRKNMQAKGTFRSKDKLKIFFKPAPKDPEINRVAKNLNIDLSTMDAKQKKHIYDTIDSSVTANLNLIYDLTLKSKNWIGSDIWRFFKNDVRDYCIDSNPEYRNILVILTDGYIYHKQSSERIKNRTSYITGPFLEKEGLRRNKNWKKKFKDADYGLISTSQDLNNLSVLILEVSTSTSNKNDEDVIKAYLTKWFDEMNIEYYQVYFTDLPSNTAQRIVHFFSAKN